MNRETQSRRRPPGIDSRRGFALLITITLLAFLVLLLVSLSTLTRVETQVADNNQRQSQARANALLALNTALGQLQKFAGPDRRVTARADLGDGTNGLDAPVDGARQWTGVWGNAAAASADRSSPVLLNWLVSGNENTALAATTDGTITSAAASPARKPAQVVGNLPGASATATNLTIDGQPARLLVGPGTVGTAASGGQGEAGYVAAPLSVLQVPAALVPGQTGANSITVGRYAWWVGDEGVKARANLAESETAVSASGDEEKRLRYRLPARAGIEAMASAPAALASANLAAPAGTALRDDLRKVVSGHQLGLVSTGTLFTDDFLKKHFHDLTTASAGVLANTLSGGLKKDLTAAFAPGTTSTTLPTGPVFSLGTADGQKGPDWQLLRSYYQLPDMPGASGDGLSLSLPPRPQTDATDTSQHGIHPIVALWQWYIEGRLIALGGGDYQLQLRHYPAIVLWNPYNVTLQDHAYQVRYYIESTAITFARISPRGSGSWGLGNAVPAAVSASAHVRSGWQTNSANAMQLTVQSGALEPGAAYVYTLPSDTAFTNASAVSSYRLTRGWHGGGMNAVTNTSAVFNLPDPSDQYIVSLWSGTTGNYFGAKTWDSVTPVVPTADTDDEPSLKPIDILNFKDSSGNDLQVIRYNNSSLTTRYSANTLLWQDLPTGTGTFGVGYIGHKWALKATALGTLDDVADFKNYPVRWLANYNPRAPYASKSPFEMQGGGGYGYFHANPNFNTVNATSSRYGGGAFNTISSAAAIPLSDISSGRAYVGMGQNTWDGLADPEVVLFDVPRAGHHVLSLGALQHAQPYRTGDIPWASNAAPAYAIGNSLADPRVGLDRAAKPWTEFTTMASTPYSSYKATAHVFDHSYLLNRALWDGYYFSGVPRAASGQPVDFPPPNPRLSAQSRNGAAPSGDDLRDYEKSAAALLVTGAFNINSTSADAWRALLSGLNNIPVGGTTRATESPYPRNAYLIDDAAVLDVAATGDAGMKGVAYRGYRFLTQTEIERLAAQIVTQVRRRGPFASLADFVNRALTAGPVPATQDNRLMGALAQALADANINAAFASGQAAQLPYKLDNNPNSGATYQEINAAAHAGPTATHTPGWLSQADLLQALGPVLSARSDTFKIRCYGEVVNPVFAPADTGYIQGRAWCEAVVQRLPDYVATADPWAVPASLTTENQTFGRRFQIISFRWLSPSDI